MYSLKYLAAIAVFAHQEVFAIRLYEEGDSVAAEDVDEPDVDSSIPKDKDDGEAGERVDAEGDAEDAAGEDQDA